MTNGFTTIDPRQYRLEPNNQSCVLSHYLVGVDSWENHVNRNGKGWGHAAAKQMRREGIEVHHICGGTSRKNYRSNLIVLHPLTHIWCQSIEVQSGKVACLYVKLLLEELDWDEIDDAAGKLMRGWIETFDLNPPFTEMRRELLR